ncbi:MAG: hypothetical protein AB7D03_10490 [Thiomicrospira sp.]
MIQKLIEQAVDYIDVVVGGERRMDFTAKASLSISVVALLVSAVAAFYNYAEYKRNVENDKVKIVADCWLDENGVIAIEKIGSPSFDVQCRVKNIGKVVAHITSGRVEYLLNGKMTRSMSYLENALPSSIPIPQRLRYKENDNVIAETINPGEFKLHKFRANYEFVPQSEAGSELSRIIVNCVAENPSYRFMDMCVRENGYAVTDLFKDGFGGGNGFHQYNQMAIFFRIHDGQDVGSLIDFSGVFSTKIRTQQECMEHHSGSKYFCNKKDYNMIILPAV